MMGLFAIISICIVWVFRSIVSHFREKKKTKTIQKLVVLTLALGSFFALTSCVKRQPIHVSQTASETPPPHPPGVFGGGDGTGFGLTANFSRSTGYQLLPSDEPEAPGYGLYSYVLLSHRPSESEKSAYKAFLRAFLGLPTSASLAKYLPKSRINITYIPVTRQVNILESVPVEKQLDLMLEIYDYGRATALLTRFPDKVNAGPTIASVLKPLSGDPDPHPVLLQDLSRAQPNLMDAYVTKFVRQVAQRDFATARTLPSFELKLRDLLEVTAVGLGMSKDAVKSWVTFAK